MHALFGADGDDEGELSFQFQSASSDIGSLSMGRR